MTEVAVAIRSRPRPAISGGGHESEEQQQGRPRRCDDCILIRSGLATPRYSSGDAIDRAALMAVPRRIPA